MRSPNHSSMDEANKPDGYKDYARLGWTEQDLERRRNPDNLAIAARLRRETILSIKSIAVIVRLGNPNNANVNLHAWMHKSQKHMA